MEGEIPRTASSERAIPPLAWVFRWHRLCSSISMVDFSERPNPTEGGSAMNVRQVMDVRQVTTPHVAGCGRQDSLTRAVQIMLEHDCGWAPVLRDGDDSKRRLATSLHKELRDERLGRLIEAVSQPRDPRFLRERAAL
jgi:hypothetical protein